jgi:serine/threonine-protein kinase
MAFNVGDSVGDYQIIGILGAGGMGKVYKVRNVISDRTEAMKVLLPNLAEAPELAERFIREIKLLASLNHSNIAGLHTALRMENQLLMMMEFVEGRTLEERLREGPITLWEAVDYMSQALSALGYAHERGVVHRDIKPANIMVTPRGQVKLMDFGIAKAMADRKLTMTGTTLGSLFYMSPEQVKGITTLDGRSDLYSVGVSLYEIVTGTRPFKGDSDYSIMVAHLEQQPVPPIQLDPTLPPGLDEVILTAIQKDPADRFQTAQAFRGALESVKQSLAPPVGGKPAVGAAAAPPAMAPTQTGGVLRQPPAPAPQATPVPPASMPAPPYAAPAPPPPYAAPVPPPQYAAPGPPPQYAAPGPPPAPPASHRGLYMALGGILVVAVLAVAAIYLPGWYRARAGGAQTPPVVDQQQPPAQQQTEAAKPPVEPGAQTPLEPAAQPPGQGPAASAQPPATSVQPPSSTGQTPRQPPPTRTGSTQPPVGAVEPPVQPQHATAAPQQIPPPVNQEALDRARERLGMLAARANAVRGSLQNLEQQQRSTGVGLRIDISASWKRMEFLLDEAEAALKRQDLAAAKRNLDNAERETDKLEQFLGR